MKTRLNLTIEETLLKQIKDYAQSRKRSISQLVEDYFKSIPKVSKKESFVDMVSNLKKTDKYDGIDFKEEYYKAKGKSHGL